MGYANLMLKVAFIPEYDYDSDKKKDPDSVFDDDPESENDRPEAGDEDVFDFGEDTNSLADFLNSQANKRFHAN